jgi:hypothetical protein
VVGVQVGDVRTGRGQLGRAARGVGQDLAGLVAHVFGDVDPLRRPARLRRTEETREQVVPLAGLIRSDRSDAHCSSLFR